jgi:hypothetical protein
MTYREEVVQELVSIWYSMLVGYHKDRDCRFTITQEWKYAGKMVWTFEHRGYLYPYEEAGEFVTYNEACDALIEWLMYIIGEESKYDNDRTEKQSNDCVEAYRKAKLVHEKFIAGRFKEEEK